MTTKHTPGPLRIEGHFIVASDGTSLGSLFNVQGWESLGSLIASAPELLDALMLARARIERLEKGNIGILGEIIDQAIAKAEGR
jgi:hypothetical protein